MLVCTVRSGQWDLRTGVVKRSWPGPGAFLQGPEKLLMAQSRESEEDRGLLLLRYLFKFRFKPVKNQVAQPECTVVADHVRMAPGARHSGFASTPGLPAHVLCDDSGREDSMAGVSGDTRLRAHSCSPVGGSGAP